ncbi:Branched-chain-amino-acid aminotransferase [Rosistilla carotiformis]|uniref:Branched-chain-amino-acid aminotransferase n=1 Tax=Rosistilla carotiformis TaxID=2528017 RepID=A0A518JZH9_9BACT|nr:aminotransferase class IV [Rosistilla carotiformis]QDV70951.1 Branched-chain-amino-acid aminotransferase [Rosistilla carotiformis]
MSIWYRCGEWFDGEIVLPLDDLGLFQGVCAVERLRTYGQRVFLLDEYLQRLQRSAATLSIDVSEAIVRLPDVIGELLQRNALSVDTGITLLVTPGDLQRRAPTVLAHLVPLDFARISRLQREGERLVLTSVVQPAAETVPRQVKHRSRIHYYLAAQQARRIDPAGTAVLLDADGSLTETASANLLLVQEGCIYGAPSERVLPGVTLSVVRQLAKAAGIPWREQPLSASMFEDADEILLTGTGPGIWFGNHRRGPIYQQLLEAFSAFTAAPA